MMRDAQALLSQEARRRPVVADAIARLDDLAEDAIMALPLLKWMRQALLARKRDGARQQSWADAEATLSAHVVHSLNPDPCGEMRRWTGPQTFLRMDRGETEIRPGWLVWLPETGGLLFQTMFSRRADPRVATHTVAVGTTTRSDYTRTYRREIAALAPPDAPALFSNLGPGTPLSHHNVRFSR